MRNGSSIKLQPQPGTGSVWYERSAPASTGNKTEGATVHKCGTGSGPRSPRGQPAWGGVATGWWLPTDLLTSDAGGYVAT